MARILIVEDEEKIARFVTLELEHEGYQVEHAADGRTAVDLALERDYDLILLDVLLPQLNGMEVLRRVRKHKDVPVIMVTARDAVMDKVAGLDAGADDYLTKPFAIEELFARIRVALKRSEAVRTASGVAAPGPERVWRAARVSAPLLSPQLAAQPKPAVPSPAALTVGSVALDPDRREVTVGGSPIALTAREFDVLALLMAHAETVLTRERIAHEALGYEYMGDTNTSTCTSRIYAPRSRTPAAPASSRPCAGWAMSAARNAEAKRVTSIARAINWSYMWRRLMSYVWLDLLLVVIAAAILVYGYNQTLPDSAFTAGWIPGATVRGMSLKPARGWDLTTLTYTVELARTTKTFPLAQDLIALWPLYIVVVGCRSSACSICSAALAVCAAPWRRSTTWPCAWTSSAACSSPAARWKRWSKPSSARASTRRASPPATPTWQASRSHSTACCARCKRPSCSRCALSTMQATSCARPSR